MFRRTMQTINGKHMAGRGVSCRYCWVFFERYRCNKPGECDCPKCQGYCECRKTQPEKQVSK